MNTQTSSEPHIDELKRRIAATDKLLRKWAARVYSPRYLHSSVLCNVRSLVKLRERQEAELAEYTRIPAPTVLP